MSTGPRTADPNDGDSITGDGGVASTSNRSVAGACSTFPSASCERTERTWTPSARPEALHAATGDHGDQGPSSKLYENSTPRVSPRAPANATRTLVAVVRSGGRERKTVRLETMSRSYRT